MNIKKVVKWLSIPLSTMIAIYVNQHNQEVFVGIIGGLGILGLCLMFNPTWLWDPTPSEEKIFKDELLNKFNDDKNDIEFKRVSLLKNFKTQYLLLCALGTVVLIVIAVCIFLFVSVENRSIGFISISILITLFMMTEGDELKVFPYSRYNRTRLIYSCLILKNDNKFQKLISKNELKKSDIGNLKKETSIDFTQIVNNINIDRSKSSTYVNNDNRVLQNNFVTTIDNSKKEIRELNVDSNFWGYFISVKGEVSDKVEALFKIVDNLNSNSFIQDGKYLIDYDRDIKKFVLAQPRPVMLAHFVKFLIDQNCIKDYIIEIQDRDHLNDLFLCVEDEPFYYFKPSRWKEINKKKSRFERYYKENEV